MKVLYNPGKVRGVCFKQNVFQKYKITGPRWFCFFFWILNQCLNPKNLITPYILPFSKLSINVSISAKIRQKSAKIAFYKSFEVIWDRIISFKSEKILIFSLYGKFISTILKWGAGS